MPLIPMLLCLPPLARPLGSVGAPFLGGQGWTLMDCRQGDSPLALPPPHPLSPFPGPLVRYRHCFNAFVFICFSCQLIFICFLKKKMEKCARQPLPRSLSLA